MPISINRAYVRLGEHNVKTNPDCQPGGPCNEPVLNAKVERVFTHPEYTEKPAAKNDVALLKLAQPVDFNKG